ncbi:hypothetical protein D9M70_590380 [compost metagenome]
MLDQVVRKGAQIHSATGQRKRRITGPDVDNRNSPCTPRLRAAGVNRNSVIASGRPGNGQGIDLAGLEVGVHEERTASARQRFHV